MPREIVHWSILEAAIKKADSTKCPSVISSLKDSQDLAYIGAIAHDAPYFYQMGNSPFTKIAGTLHGQNKQDSFAPLREFAKLIQTINSCEERNKAWSFLLGMLTHYATDLTFHPMIFYFTGDYHAEDEKERYEARRKHRTFEVFLDSWFLKNDKPNNTTLIKTLVNNQKNILEKISAMLSKAIKDPENSKEKWNKAFKHTGQLQHFFLSSFWGMLVRAANILSNKHFATVDALFSFRRREAASFF